MTRYGRDDSCAMLLPMFTGIITDIGELVDRRDGRFAIRCGYQAEGIAIGASIACDGACLTATDIRSADNGCVFTVDVSNETLSRTTLGDWRPGARINLERALKAGDELGGHIVSGHVDGVGRIVGLRADGSSRRFIVEVPAELGRLPGAQGIRRAGRHLAHRQRGYSKPIWHQYRPPHLDPHHLGREKARRPGQPGGRRLCPLRGAGHGVQDVKDGLKTATYAEGKGFLSPIDEIIEDLRNGRMIILVDAEDRENEGDLVVPAQMATPDAINFMAKHGRGLICLSLTGAARDPAPPRAHGAPERGAQPHGLHRLHRGTRGHRHRHLGP